MRIRRLVTLMIILLSVLSASIACIAPWSQRTATGNDESRDRNRAEPLTLDQLVSGQLKIIDLGWSLNDKNPYWPAADYEPFRLKTIATIEKNQPAVDEIEPAQLFAHGIVIDVTMQAGADADYRLTKADIEDWEKANGRIPEGAVVLLSTGWGRHWNNYPRYKNQDATGKMHFPGYSAEAAKFLVEERRAKGLGIDTLSIDYGLSKDFAVHHIVNAAGRYGLENVAHLDLLPPKGFYVVTAPIKIETGSGGPTRLFAVLKK